MNTPPFLPSQPNLYNLVPPQLAQIPHIPQVSQLLELPPPPLPPTTTVTPVTPVTPVATNSAPVTKAQRRKFNESEAARAKRLAKNAERMRQKRATISFEEYKVLLAKNAERMRQKRATLSYEEYKIRLAKNAESNRRRRQNETEAERALRHMRNAMRQRLARAMETPEQKAIRRAKLAARMREVRANETPEQRKMRLEKGAARARHIFLTETQEQRMERNRKKAEYARLLRLHKQELNKNPTGQVQDLTRAKEERLPPVYIKSEHPSQSVVNPTQQQQPQHIPPQNTETAPVNNRDQTYPPTKNNPVNYHDFGAFPTFFNYPPLKNGQQTPYNPVYTPQSYYPEIPLPPHYTKSERAPYPAPKTVQCPPAMLNPPKETSQKN